MSDPEFERRVAAAMRAPVSASSRAREAIMDRGRAVAPHERPRRRSAGPRITTRYSVAGLAAAAGIGSITTLSALYPQARATAPAALASAVIGDSVSSTLRDTLRLVRLIFDDSTARQVAAAGDFNDWRPAATPMRHDAGTPRWSTTVALRDGAHRYAFVVDGTRWIPDPNAERVRGEDGRVYSILHVARLSN
jgi:1,4-alpha-glucan branching enzyme